MIDLTSDLKIPVFAALSRETDGREERIVPGFGAHLDPHVALLRAVTEMNQMLSNLPEGTARPGPGEPIDDQETLEWLRSATVANQPYLLPDAAAQRTAPRRIRGRGPTTSPRMSGCARLWSRGRGWR